MEVIWTGSLRLLPGGSYGEWCWGHELFRDLIDGTLYRMRQGKEQAHLSFGTFGLRKLNRREHVEYKEWESRGRGPS